MARIAKTIFAAATVALLGLMPALSSDVLAGGGKRHHEGYEDGGKNHKQFRKNRKHGNGPSFGILEGGPRLMIVIEPKRVGPPVVKGKNNCEHLRRQIAAGERRLAQMNERVDQLLSDFRVKRVNSTRADATYTADAALKLDQDAKDMERALKKLRKKLKACEAAQWF